MQENVLLRWCEWNHQRYFSLKKPQRLTDFHDLRDGTYFETILQNYVGKFKFIYSTLRDIHRELSSEEDAKFNMERIFKALKQINLKTHFRTIEDFWHNRFN